MAPDVLGDAFERDKLLHGSVPVDVEVPAHPAAALALPGRPVRLLHGRFVVGQLGGVQHDHVLGRGGFGALLRLARYSFGFPEASACPLFVVLGRTVTGALLRGAV